MWRRENCQYLQGARLRAGHFKLFIHFIIFNSFLMQNSSLYMQNSSFLCTWRWPPPPCASPKPSKVSTRSTVYSKNLPRPSYVILHRQIVYHIVYHSRTSSAVTFQTNEWEIKYQSPSGNCEHISNGQHSLRFKEKE